MEVKMLLMNYFQKYASGMKQDIDVKVFNMIARITKAKTLVKNI